MLVVDLGSAKWSDRSRRKSYGGRMGKSMEAVESRNLKKAAVEKCP